MLPIAPPRLGEREAEQFLARLLRQQHADHDNRDERDADESRAASPRRCQKTERRACVVSPG
jgi:hypothetical protein